MTTTMKRLSGPGLLTGSAVTKYTVPAATITYKIGFHVNNTTASPVTFTASIGSDAAGTEIYTAYVIPANTAVDLYPAVTPLAATETIQALAGTASALNLTISGVEMTLG